MEDAEGHIRQATALWARRTHPQDVAGRIGRREAAQVQLECARGIYSPDYVVDDGLRGDEVVLLELLCAHSHARSATQRVCEEAALA